MTLDRRRTARPVTAAQRERADELFDRLSSLLRDAADPTAVLRRADKAFDVLHRHLRDGGALPSPWLDARR
ncbi:hypothetical protein SUDANB121_00943 [Nocardiopsis dassonvillei]|uniref:hypothetical protein n=1 Tax=Nocardiopsis dassonvillei TaxID=2014 RepID=UPI003F559302